MVGMDHIMAREHITFLCLIEEQTNRIFLVCFKLEGNIAMLILDMTLSQKNDTCIIVGLNSYKYW